MEGRKILVKRKIRSGGNAELRVTIVVADGLSARQGHSPYVLKYFEKVSHPEISELPKTVLRI